MSYKPDLVDHLSLIQNSRSNYLDTISRERRTSCHEDRLPSIRRSYEDSSEPLTYSRSQPSSNRVDFTTQSSSEHEFTGSGMERIMDPLGCLAVAAAIVPFVDFATHHTSDTFDINSPASKNIADTIVLSKIVTKIEHFGQNIQGQLNLLPYHDLPNMSAETVLARISKQCKEVGIQLQSFIEKCVAEYNEALREDLTKDHLRDNAANIAAALRKMNNVHQISSWSDQLVSIRQKTLEVSIAILWYLSISHVRTVLQLIPKSREPLREAKSDNRRSARQVDLAAALGHTEDTGRTLSQSLLHALREVLSEAHPNRSAIIQAIWSSESSPVYRDPGTEEYYEQRKTSTLAGCGDNNCPAAIIRSLEFQGMHRREEAISMAYQGTFDWIFADNPISTRGSEQWSDLTCWLSIATADTYWITGKPGAGKSTLMKFLAEHENVRKCLQDWSCDKQLVLASFYFWNAGSEPQRSQKGLLQTLLHQILTQMPSIAVRVCPRRWALFKIFGKQAAWLAPKWTWEELIESFSFLLPLVGHEFQLALFIDGLDEFDGDQNRLITFIELLRSHQGVKICVSSRPETAFSDAFRCSSSLRVEDLTRNDIETFVREEFSRTVGFLELRSSFPSKSSQLIKDIVERSKGVFLWVTLVVRTLREGLTDGEDLTRLQATLDELPTDLSELYWRIWLRIRPQHISHSSQLFQIRYISTMPLHIVTLWLADGDNNLDSDIIDVKTKRGEYIRENVGRRLNSHTKGLLEVSIDGCVEYLHRSVKDWMTHQWSEIRSKAAADFDPHLVLLKALVIESTDHELWDPRERIVVRTTEEIFWGNVGVYFYHASRIRNHGPNIQFLVKTLNRLDSTLDRVSRTYRVGPPGLRANQTVSHWSDTQDNGRSNTFLSFNAQFAVTPYVQHMVKTKAGLLQSSASRLHILGGAVLGFHHFSHREVRDWCGTQSSLNHLDSRLALVRFLCENGAMRFKASRAPRSSVEWHIHDKIQTKMLNSQSSEDTSYWRAVVELLDADWNIKGEKRKSFLGWQMFRKKEDKFSLLDDVMKGSPY